MILCDLKKLIICGKKSLNKELKSEYFEKLRSNFEKIKDFIKKLNKKLRI